MSICVCVLVKIIMIELFSPGGMLSRWRTNTSAEKKCRLFITNCESFGVSGASACAFLTGSGHGFLGAFRLSWQPFSSQLGTI